MTITVTNLTRTDIEIGDVIVRRRPALVPFLKRYRDLLRDSAGNSRPPQFYAKLTGCK